MLNPRITSKERNLIKGAIRRVFSRSELRKQALDASRIEYFDPERKRVTKWSRCPICVQPTPTYLMEVDHQEPIVPLDSSLDRMSWDEVVNRIWCELQNLKAICKDCHKAKTKEESKKRRQNKKNGR